MVVRLGQTNKVEISQRYRILQGQTLTLQYASDTTLADLRAWARVRYDNGEDAILFVPDTVAVTDPITVTTLRSDVARMDGWVTDALVECLTSDIQRGQVYVRLFLDPFGPVLCSDYCWSTFGQVALGTYIQSGPGGGMGNLRLVTIKALGAPAASTAYILRELQIIKKVREIAWYYETSADVATRVLNITLTEPLGPAPAGMAASPIWASLTLTLTANQDGIHFLDEKRSGDNDAGTLVIEDAAVNPTILPLWATSDMDSSYAMFFKVVDGEVLDEDVIWGLVETWVVL